MMIQRIRWMRAWTAFLAIIFSCLAFEQGMAADASSLSLDVSETAAAPGDFVFAFGELMVDTDPPEVLPDRRIIITVRAPDGSFRETETFTNDDGLFVIIIEDFNQQGAYTIEAFFPGDVCQFVIQSKILILDTCYDILPTFADTDVSIVGDLQLRAPIENLDVYSSVVFRWEAYQGRNDVLYDLVIARDPNFEEIIQELPKLEAPSALLNLESARRFYWRVDVFERSVIPGGIPVFLTTSALSSFATNLAFEGIVAGLVTSNLTTQGINGAVVNTEFTLFDAGTDSNSPDQIVTFTGQDGQKGFYIFHTSEKGTKSITVRAEGFLEETVNKVTVPPRQPGVDPVPVPQNVELAPMPDAPPTLPGTYGVTGVVRHATERTPLGALVLANGNFEFTPFAGGPDDGSFSLQNVYLDSNEKITLFAFADGFAPFLKEFSPSETGGQLNTEVLMVRAPADLPQIQVFSTVEEATGPNKISISGTVRDEAGKGLGALMLANGVHTFSQVGEGTFVLADIPLDTNGQFTLFGFAFGFVPYKEESAVP